jgi:anti-sigma-K factor RskA
MSGAGETDDPRDTLAGEYVLGLLDEAAARDVERRAATEAPLAAAIAAWRNRLDPLADLAPPVPPSDVLWHRIAADLPAAAVAAPAPAPSPHRSSAWRLVALASLAVAACLALVIWRGLPAAPPVPWARGVALLAAPGTVQAAIRVQALSDGTMTIVPLEKLPLPDGRRLGFWAWPRSEKAPVLLGMLPPDGGQVHYPFPVQDATPVMVTSEPGSGPVSAPGPTLFLGLMAVTS